VIEHVQTHKQVHRHQKVQDSGLLLSQEDAKGFRYMKALVISVGHEVHTVKEGESIYYDKSAGHTLLIGNEPFTVIREADVVVVM
jgi:co-chaperonin GroES (HSP10)